MRRRKPVQKAKSAKSAKFAIFFGLLILMLILSALCIKIVLLFTKSKFDGKHQFLLRINSQAESQLIAFNPDTKSIAEITYKASSENQPDIPVDATIYNISFVSPSDLTTKLLFHIQQIHSLTPIDIINLFIFSREVSDKDIALEPINLPLDSTEISTLNKLFTDNTIYQEGQSVGIINATDTMGLGNTISQMLSHIGVNIISVTSSIQETDKSVIRYTGDKTYTVKRLASLLGIPAQKTQDQQVTDIMIIIGKDKAGNFK